jgi:hypothetical protein
MLVAWVILGHMPLPYKAKAAREQEALPKTMMRTIMETFGVTIPA